jgi:hypothetical protein
VPHEAVWSVFDDFVVLPNTHCEQEKSSECGDGPFSYEDAQHHKTDAYDEDQFWEGHNVGACELESNDYGCEHAEVNQ